MDISISANMAGGIMNQLEKKTKLAVVSKTGKIKRKYSRIPVSNVVCDIADGSFVFQGFVEDISSAGVKISQLPQTFSSERKSYRVIVTSQGKNFRIIVFPCWTNSDKLSQKAIAGFKIVEASWEWEEFVLGMEAGTENAQSLHFHA